MADKRVCFDFEVEFSNGGGIQGQGFRLDVAGDDIDDAALAAYIIKDLRLLMVGSVRILHKRIIEEPHKRPAETVQVGFVRAEAGTEFQIDRIEMVGNTGTYLDSPFHRYAHGDDLAGLKLTQVADQPGVVVRVEGALDRAIDWTHFAP